MSRVEGILDGTYTGPPLSRVEQLLKNSGGGGNTDLTDVYAKIQTVKNLTAVNERSISSLQTTQSQITEDISSVNENISNLKETVGELKTHALTDAPIS